MGGVLGVSLLGAGTYYATKKARADVEKDRPIMVSGITAGEMASISKFPGPDGAAVAGLFTPPVAAAAVGGAALAAIPSNKAAPASASPTTFLAAPVMPTGLAPPNAYSDPYAGAAFSPRVESASFNSQDVPSNVVVVPEGAHVVPESERRKWTATRPFRAGMEDELDIEVGDICEVVMRHDGEL